MSCNKPVLLMPYATLKVNINSMNATNKNNLCLKAFDLLYSTQLWPSAAVTLMKTECFSSQMAKKFIRCLLGEMKRLGLERVNRVLKSENIIKVSECVGFNVPLDT